MSHSFTIKKTDSFESNYELLAEGWHSFEIVNAYDTTRSGDPLETRKGIPMFKIICREPSASSIVIHYLFLDPEQAGRVSAFLAAIGYEFEDGQEINLDVADFVGEWFRGRIEHSSGTDGIVRGKITRVERLETTDEEEVEEVEVTPETSDPLEVNKADDEPPPVTKEEEDEVPF